MVAARDLVPVGALFTVGQSAGTTKSFKVVKPKISSSWLLFEFGRLWGIVGNFMCGHRHEILCRYAHLGCTIENPGYWYKRNLGRIPQ